MGWKRAGRAAGRGRGGDAWNVSVSRTLGRGGGVSAAGVVGETDLLEVESRRILVKPDLRCILSAMGQVPRPVVVDVMRELLLRHSGRGDPASGSAAVGLALDWVLVWGLQERECL